jgi:hypothetical protein
MQELVQRKREELIVAPKFSSSGMAEHYVISPDIEQLKRMPKIPMEESNVRSSAC